MARGARVARAEVLCRNPDRRGRDFVPGFRLGAPPRSRGFRSARAGEAEIRGFVPKGLCSAVGTNRAQAVHKPCTSGAQATCLFWGSG